MVVPTAGVLLGGWLKERQARARALAPSLRCTEASRHEPGEPIYTPPLQAPSVKENTSHLAKQAFE